MNNNTVYQVIVTARGRGERMKAISPKPKHLLYFRDKRIVDYIRDIFTSTENPMFAVLDGGPDNSRAETLEIIRDRNNVDIVDCDIIPAGFVMPDIDEDFIVCFESDNPKYGGIYADENMRVSAVVEKGDTGAKYRASGIYFLKNVGATIDRMTDPNSIASGMIGARIVLENTFIRVGDPEDYLAALA